MYLDFLGCHQIIQTTEKFLQLQVAWLNSYLHVCRHHQVGSYPICKQKIGWQRLLQIAKFCSKRDSEQWIVNSAWMASSSHSFILKSGRLEECPLLSFSLPLTRIEVWWLRNWSLFWSNSSKLHDIRTRIILSHRSASVKPEAGFLG